MAELGSIFEAETHDGARGRDLRAKVRYPGWALGDPEGVSVEVPLELEIDGEMARRTRSPYDEGALIRLNLPENFPDGGTLRLRGQGESVAEGRPGDLLVTVSIGGDAPAPARAVGEEHGVSIMWWVVLIVGVIGGAVALLG
ncbi:MAG: hypothetical protein IPK80_21555 [Nannocystis sp.]|nr:hypothetical protein [Nannocystis sp.]